MDGHCAGAIVYQAMKNQEDDGTGFEFIPINYNHDFPFEKIRPNEEVVIVDFSLQKPGDFEKLLNITSRIIWIDHHKTAIEKHSHLDRSIKGIRRDGVSGCELTWAYFTHDKPTPIAVALLGDYDIWAFKYGEDTNLFQAASRLYDTKPESEIWKKWLNPKYDLLYEIEAGKVALKYRDNYYAGLVKAWGFPVIFEGYRAICCNAGSVSSQLFDTVPESDYDIMMPFVFDGTKWTVSLYTKKKEIDVSEIAKRYGGGGHRQASGFQCEKLPFNPEAR
jgi:oligoribonuclease NrnB/cAMP/cGMP phosphodiesterase (DHH superfamily)